MDIYTGKHYIDSFWYDQRCFVSVDILNSVLDIIGWRVVGYSLNDYCIVKLGTAKILQDIDDDNGMSHHQTYRFRNIEEVKLWDLEGACMYIGKIRSMDEEVHIDAVVVYDNEVLRRQKLKLLDGNDS